jgi:type I restriction enzyme S subunit
MNSDWPNRQLQEVAREITVGHVGLMASEYVDTGIPFLRSLNIEPFRTNQKDLKYISAEFHQRIKKSKLKPGDVVIVRTGKPGTCAVIPDWLLEANCSDVVIVRCGDEIRPKFLCYWVNSIASAHISSHIVGAVQQHFNVGAARTMHVAVPSLEKQDQVLQLLCSLDDRITLLRETNETLESIAQAIFKSWFVDFDPVRAKMEGRQPEGMDEETAALFPDSLEESGREKLPRGWRKGSVYETCHVIYGAPFSSKLFNGERLGSPLIRIRDLKNETPGIFTEEIHSKGYMVQPGDIVVGMDGEFRAYVWGGEAAWLNQRVCVFQPKLNFNHSFVLFSMRPLLAAVEESETATTVIHLGKNDIDRFDVLIPPESIVAAFSDVTTSLYRRIVSGKQMATSLASIRTSLLPRLISGQLRLPEAQEQIEKALS